MSRFEMPNPLCKRTFYGGRMIQGTIGSWQVQNWIRAERKNVDGPIFSTFQEAKEYIKKGSYIK